MKIKILILVLVFSILLSSCYAITGTVVGKNNVNGYSVDVKTDDGKVYTVDLSKDKFYSGDYEIGKTVSANCVVLRCK